MPRVKVTIKGRERPATRAFKARASVIEEALAEMGINPQDVLVRLNGEFVPDTQRLSPGDRLELIEITSRG
jgi:sulfur carrier protein ThiS